ncbi:hypothetical protein NVS55_18930 [Myxococcus stipitatus]|uniref:hypothetical protein n=1 Tax=Myxococcus stipitatus TaxID=83455 RepID=UPI003145316A
MLIFLKSNGEANDVITVPRKERVLARDTAAYKRIADGAWVIVPWYGIKADPAAFGKWLLGVAAADAVCVALVKRATSTWGVDFSIKDGGEFAASDVQAHYLKLLKVWLSPLSGNLEHLTAHRATPEQQYARLWSKYKLDETTLSDLATLPFFADLKVAGRRDRIQIYRNVTEAARALVGEVTSWPSRMVEKIAVLSLMRSPSLIDCQLQMLQAVAKGVRDNSISFNCENWEYLSYYLRKVPAEGALERRNDKRHGTLLKWQSIAEPRVHGALQDALNDAGIKPPVLDEKVLNDFKGLAGGEEYRRWRKLPPVVRYQVLISDLPRFLGGKHESDHVRVEFKNDPFKDLPDNLWTYSSWETEMYKHKIATPHAPGKEFPFAATWSRNEFCPNVVSSRLMLAPLYAGTSGHNQGRILAWRALAKQLGALADIPLGLVISAGYSVLWRMYYDKRVSGFHTMFETFQGTHMDDQVRDLSGMPVSPEDVAWSAVLNASPSGKTDVKAFWSECIRIFGRSGWLFHRELKAALAKARQDALDAFPGAVIPRWSTTDNVDDTAPDVNVWSEAENQEVLNDYANWEGLAELPTSY